MKKIIKKIERIKNFYLSMRDFWRGDKAAVISFNQTKKKIHYKISCKNTEIKELGNIILGALSNETKRG